MCCGLPAATQSKDTSEHLELTHVHLMGVCLTLTHIPCQSSPASREYFPFFFFLSFYLKGRETVSIRASSRPLVHPPETLIQISHVLVMDSTARAMPTASQAAQGAGIRSEQSQALTLSV